jgi:hypothetical protein
MEGFMSDAGQKILIDCSGLDQRMQDSIGKLGLTLVNEGLGEVSAFNAEGKREVVLKDPSRTHDVLRLIMLYNLQTV